jgi:hypothetical protein
MLDNGFRGRMSAKESTRVARVSVENDFRINNSLCSRSRQCGSVERRAPLPGNRLYKADLTERIIWPPRRQRDGNMIRSFACSVFAQAWPTGRGGPIRPQSAQARQRRAVLPGNKPPARVEQEYSAGYHEARSRSLDCRDVGYV